MEVRINKEIRDYQESVFFGLSLRQFAFSLAAVLVAAALYFLLKEPLGVETAGWACVLAAFPFALCGFFRYNGMSAERFLLTFLRSAFICPKRLVFKADNLYAIALADSGIKEELKID
ncbi:MAG: PrgI family protein [Oscillospiraceae bacterium]|nr:PrgI family protein [Oscillospiraceae bacterium]